MEQGSLSEETKAKFLQTVNADFRESANALVDKHQQFLDYTRLYLNHKDEKKKKGRANAPVPLIKKAINVVTAHMVSKLFSGGNLQVAADVRPMRQSISPETLVSEFRGGSITNLLRYDADIDGAKRKLRRMIQTALTYGNCPGKVEYTKNQRSMAQMIPIQSMTGTSYIQTVQRQTIYEGATLITIDPLDFFPSPALTDINDDLFKIRRFKRSQAELISGITSKHYDPAAILEVLELMKESADSNGKAQTQPDITSDALKRDRRSDLEVNYSLDKTGFVTCLEWEGKFDINDDGYEVDTCGVIAQIGGGVVLKCYENPYISQDDTTFVCGSIYQLEGEFWGIGLADSMNPMQKAATDLQNAVLDAYYKYSRRRTYVRKNSIVNTTDIDKGYGILEIDDDERPIGDIVMEETPIEVGQDAMMLMGKLDADSQSASGANDPNTGTVPGQRMTATLSNIVATAGGLIFEDILGQFEESLVLPYARKVIEINQQFINEEFIVRVLGQDSIYWQKIRPDEIAGQISVISLASQRSADRQIRAEQIARALQIVGANQALWGIMPEAFVEWWKAMDLPNIERVKLLVGYYPMMQQMMQAQQMQMTPLQVFVQQGIAQGQPVSQPGNEVPYTTSQQDAPANQEEMANTMQTSMTQNAPTQY